MGFSASNRLKGPTSAGDLMTDDNRTMLKLILLILILILAGGAFLQWSRKSEVLTRYTVRTARAAFDGFRIAHVSDLQSEYFGADQQRLAKTVKAASPDIIVFTGDLADRNHTDYEASLAAMRELTAIAPVYFVNGNHELALPENCISQMYDEMDAMGVHRLFDRRETITRGEERMVLLGISEETLYAAKGVRPGDDQPGRTYTAFDTGVITEAVERLTEGLRAEDLAVLLVHEPQYLDAYASAAGGRLDLIFAGHAHGGQIRLPFTEGLFAPGQGILPKLTSGIHSRGKTSMVISRGLGNSVFPFRVFNRPEVVVCELKRFQNR